MIKQFIKKLFSGPEGGKSDGGGKKPKTGKRVEVAAADHGINPEFIDQRATDVVSTLQRAGFEAYIVGGAVRDLLLGLRPKDFDVATSATPEEVKALFRRAFIIGRRFRIVHVVYGRGREHEVIEVSTFRALLDNAQADTVAGNEKTSKAELAGMQHAVDASGRVLRDNVWGPQDEDATRRDFTINAMYYDPTRQLLVDFHNGLKDARAKTLRMIGDPATRLREDPVRIVRALRFVAKLAATGFKLEGKTQAAMKPALPLLADVPQSRMFDEMLKLLQTGHAMASVAQLKALGFEKGIYPLLDLIVARADQPLVRGALADTDRRVGDGKSVVPSFLLACVLWQDVNGLWQHKMRGMHPFAALQEAIDEVFDQRIGDVSGRGRLGGDMREIWLMQPRFERRTGSAPFGLVGQPRFRAAFDFLRLRADVGEVPEELATWWEDFSLESDAGREAMVQEQKDLLRDRQREQQRSQRAAPKLADTSPRSDGDRQDISALPPGASFESPADAGMGAGEGSTPAKKRRRRRKPRGPGEGGSTGVSSAGGGTSAP